MAIAPAWTIELARAANFPAPEDVRDFFEAAVDTGIFSMVHPLSGHCICGAVSRMTGGRLIRPARLTRTGRVLRAVGRALPRLVVLAAIESQVP